MAVEHGVGAVLIAGDIFDTKHVLPRERDVFMEWLFDHDRLGGNHGFNTVMISGNHDEIEDGYTLLHGLRRFQDRGLLRWTEIVEVHARTVKVRPGLVAACLPAAGYRRDELGTAVATMRKAFDLQREKSKEPEPYFVVMAHEAVAGAYNESGTYRARGPGIDTSLDVTYWALGDIHKPYQQMAPNAWYPGSPIQHEFGDISQTRGALLVDLDDPTEPQPLQIEGVVPLVTLYDRPEQWPTDAIVRFEGTADEIADGYFPDNVVAFKPLVEVEDRARDAVAIDLAGYALLDGIEDVMAELAVPTQRWEAVGNKLRATMDACR